MPWLSTGTTTERFKFIMNMYSLMPRPRRHRHIRSSFDYDYWRPCATCLQDIDVVVLKMEEMESIRLKDHLGMDQREAAELMKVSQPTFHRILAEARKKIGCALVCGKAIRIHGGTYEMAVPPGRKFRCYDCQHVWEVAHGTGRPQNCPNCGSVKIGRAEDDRGYARAGSGVHGRHGMQ
uniref:UPF0251 protein LLFONJKP_00024 n=1 Tax=Candidatus Methanogaster sp. ANME-2c ERB4 TaxID=2759911 RepID=A0A7G9YIR9_9EURY|nr:hypothetical protein LLFONJKP_00024 [Methanosarcinales archaeon ANME-2c ERB4]